MPAASLTNNYGYGILRGNFEYAVEVFPYWQSFTPKFQKVSCTQTVGSALVNCSHPYTVGGTFTGASVTPIILRWNFARTGKGDALDPGSRRRPLDKS